MPKYFTSFLLILASLVAFAKPVQPVTAHSLMDRVSGKDTTYIVNFWATWCGPCVKELPAFDTLQHYYAGKPVKVLLVSFDFKEDYQQKITAFVQKKKTQPEIVWFSETNADEFIPVIDNRWSGALPGTLVIHGKDRQFFEGTITTPQIIEAVKKLVP